MRQQGRSKLDKQVDQLLTRREEYEAIIVPAKARHAATVEAASQQADERPFGVIKEVLRAVELDKPGDTKPAVELLRARPGGKRYLKVTYSLDLRKLLQAPAELRAQLRPLGFWWGRHRTLSVKSPSSEEPKQLSRRRYNERS